MSDYYQPLRDYIRMEFATSPTENNLREIEQICSRLGAPKTIPETPVSRFTRLLNKQDDIQQ